MKAKCVALLLGMLLLGATNAGATTYAVSLFDGLEGVAVGGSITTDGTVGTLSTSNIVDWNLIGTSENLSLTTLFDLTGPLSGDNSFINSFGNIVATPTTLSLGIPGGDVSFEDSNCMGSCDLIVIGLETFHGSLANFQVCILRPSTTCGISADTNNLVIGDGKVAPTPLPATLPLFATGLGSLGLLGWRRKRRAVA
jgi:hypothetical protein